jgi:hypothetical protein
MENENTKDGFDLNKLILECELVDDIVFDPEYKIISGKKRVQAIKILNDEFYKK